LKKRDMRESSLTKHCIKRPSGFKKSVSGREGSNTEGGGEKGRGKEWGQLTEGQPSSGGRKGKGGGLLGGRSKVARGNVTFKI